jgi:hypothetical protein
VPDLRRDYYSFSIIGLWISTLSKEYSLGIGYCLGCVGISFLFLLGLLYYCSHTIHIRYFYCSYILGSLLGVSSI